MHPNQNIDARIEPRLLNFYVWVFYLLDVFQDLHETVEYKTVL